jgi:hypothetical protein
MLGIVETLNELEVVEDCDGSSWLMDPGMLNIRFPFLGARGDILSGGLCSVVPVLAVDAVLILLTAWNLP